MTLYNPGNPQEYVVVSKGSDQIVNNSAVLVNDTDLVIPVLANEVWILQVLFLILAASATPDFDYKFTVPVAASMGSCVGWSITTVNTLADITTEKLCAIPAATPVVLQFTGIYRGGANAGSCQLQWAQNVAHASDTTLQAGSMMRYVQGA